MRLNTLAARKCGVNGLLCDECVLHDELAAIYTYINNLYEIGVGIIILNIL